MKKPFLLILFSLLQVLLYAAGTEKVCVLTNTGSTGDACSPSELGFVEPCETLTFLVQNRIPPDGFVIVAKYEWFLNGTLVKTTINPTDFGLEWKIKTKTTTVYCKVTYKKQDGSLSDAYTSTSFTPNVKQLNFDGITPLTAQPNYGCTSNEVSYKLNNSTCSGFLCSSIYAPTQYTITWQPPAGWIQTSVSPDGKTVSFLPDAATGGTLTATIALPCGYTETKTYTVNRAAGKPTFASSNRMLCTSPANVAINPVCGAVDYTYTIEGSAEVTFASSNQQTLTTSSTNPSLNFSGSAFAFVLKVKANYPGSLVSAAENAAFYYGVPPVDFVSFFNSVGARVTGVLHIPAIHFP